jgi:alpha-aminoadipate carrier protein LysW
MRLEARVFNPSKINWLESDDSSRWKNLDSKVWPTGCFAKTLESKNQRRIKMSTVSCPECAAEVTLAAGTEVGEILVCPDCGVDLEVTALQPPAVQLAPMEEEDWGE